MKAALFLAEQHPNLNAHFLLLGNKGNEAAPHQALIKGTTAEESITFGGYRDDIAELHKSCYAGIIASTGWDSFTCSSIEMLASGLPLIVSNLPGLRETIADKSTGLHFTTANHVDLAKKIITLLEKPELQKSLSEGARKRAVNAFSLKAQINNFTQIIQSLDSLHH
jgi:glycosyltransferase involved in cell wall biosynthesis